MNKVFTTAAIFTAAMLAAASANAVDTNTTASSTAQGTPTNNSPTGLSLGSNPNVPAHNHTGRDDNPVANTTPGNGLDTNPAAVAGVTPNAANATSTVKVTRGTHSVNSKVNPNATNSTDAQ